MHLKLSTVLNAEVPWRGWQKLVFIAALTVKAISGSVFPIRTLKGGLTDA